MKVSYNYLGEQFADVEPYFQDLRELVKSGDFTLGAYVDRFEKKFAEYIGVKHVISTNTGTDALIHALRAVGVSPGDEVITAANSFYASAGAAAAIYAKPRFCDVDARMQMCPNSLAKAITKHTKAIIPVHWAGSPPEMDEILKIAAAHNIPIVEDACPSVGAMYKGKKAGTFGKVNAFSMHPLKPLNVWGDGGMIVTNDDDAANWLRCFRNHGMVDRDHISMWGVNSRLQPVQAVVATRLLDTMEDLIEARIRNAARLDEGLKSLAPKVRIIERKPYTREVYQLYIARVQNRDPLVSFLHDHGVDAKIHYPVPLHLQRPGRDAGYKEGDFPEAEAQAHEVITLPSHQHCTLEQMDYTVDMIAKFYRSH